MSVYLHHDDPHKVADRMLGVGPDNPAGPVGSVQLVGPDGALEADVDTDALVDVLKTRVRGRILRIGPPGRVYRVAIWPEDPV